MSRNEPLGPDGYDPINDVISHVLFALIVAVFFAVVGLVIWALASGEFAHGTVRHAPHPHARPHFHYDPPPVYGKKMADDVPYVGFTTDLLRELRCCRALDQ